MLLLPAQLWYHYLVVLLPLAALAWSRADARQRGALIVSAAAVSFGIAWLPLATLGAMALTATTVVTLWPRVRQQRTAVGADTSRVTGRMRRRALLHGATIAGLLFLGYLFVVLAPLVKSVGYDAWAYWNVQLPHPYSVALGGLGSFPYSPPMPAAWSSRRLPWWIFLFGWICAMVGTLIWLGGRWTLVLLAFPPVALELYHGNIHLFMAAAIVIGFRHPSAWAFILLTKSTSGIGLLWFVVRREWRQLGIALGATAAIAGVSFVIAPSLWSEWISFLASRPGGTPGGPSVPVPLPIRLAVAVVVVVWGARTDRRWTVPVASAIALPVLWFAGFAILCAIAPEMCRRDSAPD